MTKAKNPKYNRLSEALRQNLLKRKEQQRNRLKSEEENDLNETSQTTGITNSVFIPSDQEEKK
ncbi:MAG: hypothetical protein K2W94_03750 [Alphaproteobacteria bacterium]|nr:hypothetical protein [Alphaproteobacteria bacterium]